MRGRRSVAQQDGASALKKPAPPRGPKTAVEVIGGFITLALYIVSDKEPRPGTHEAFVKPLAQVLGSTYTASPATLPITLWRAWG